MKLPLLIPVTQPTQPFPPLSQFRLPPRTTPTGPYVTCDVCGKTAKAKGLKSHKNSITCYVETELKRLRAKGFTPTSILRRPRCIRLGIPHEFGPTMARSDFKRRQGHILYGLWVPQWADQTFLLRSSKKWTDKVIKLCLGNENKTEEIKQLVSLRNETVAFRSTEFFFKAAKFVNEPFMKEITGGDLVYLSHNKDSKLHRAWFHPDGKMFVCCASLTDKKKTPVDDPLEVTATLVPKDQLPLCWAFALQLIGEKEDLKANLKFTKCQKIGSPIRTLTSNQKVV